MPASRFIWYELATSDLDAAAAFYGAVVGWSVAPGPPNAGPPGADYRMWVMDGTPVGGLMVVPPEAAAAGMRPGWFGYLSVDDVDACVAAVVAAGGRVLMPGTDVAAIGRIAMVTDPQGAAIYVMAPAQGGESTCFAPGRAGHCGWNELRTQDGEAALAFYGAQFGWVEAGRMPMGPMGSYIMFGTSGEADSMLGGMMGAVPEHAAWLYYFGVTDIVAAQGRVTAAGARCCAARRRCRAGCGWCRGATRKVPRLPSLGRGWRKSPTDPRHRAKTPGEPAPYGRMEPTGRAERHGLRVQGTSRG